MRPDDPMGIACPYCSAPAGASCYDRNGTTRSYPHAVRDRTAVQQHIQTVACPFCHADIGQRCHHQGAPTQYPHAARRWTAYGRKPLTTGGKTPRRPR